MNKLIKSLIILASLTANNLYAAEQGSLVYGDKSINSSGNLNISLEIAHAIQINKLNDINLGSFRSAIDSDKVGNDNFCVFSNTESFSLSFLGENSEGFNLNESSNSNMKIPYQVEIATINTSGIKSSYNRINHNTTLNNIIETRTDLNCESVNSGNLGFKPNLDIKIKVKENNMLDAIPGNYKDTITIIASPE
jgi:hypothetical protein